MERSLHLYINNACQQVTNYFAIHIRQKINFYYKDYLSLKLEICNTIVMKCKKGVLTVLKLGFPLIKMKVKVILY